MKNQSTMSDDSGSGGGCFSGIERLLLCRGSLQTHPSDDNNNSALLMPNLKVEEAPHSTTNNNPGVVARLMGLESFPQPDPNLLVTRSRSVNFMDYYLHPSSSSSFDNLELDHQFKQKHRRVRACVSFREDDQVSDPVVFSNYEKEHDFFVFSLDNHKMIEKVNKKSENNAARQIRKQEKLNEIPKMTTSVQNAKAKRENKLHKKKIMIAEEVVVLKKQKNQRNLKDNFRVQRRNQTSRSKQVSSNPNKKDGVPLMNKELVVESKFINKIKDQHQLPNLSGKKSSPKLSNYYKVNKSTEQKRVIKKGYTEEVKKLTEEDMKESKWVIEFQNIEGMCLYFGEQIVDLLVEKLVEELVFVQH